MECAHGDVVGRALPEPVRLTVGEVPGALGVKLGPVVIA